ncbi:MAG: methionine synthase, partial [Tannerella sp.]|nr:methionine synthase [Tannerella sp.]
IPAKPGIHRINIAVRELVSYIDWPFFFTAWRMSAKFGNRAFLTNYGGGREEWMRQFADSDPEKAEEARHLYSEARRILDEIVSNKDVECKAVVGLFPTFSTGDSIVVNEEIVFPMLRQQTPNEQGLCLSLADFVLPQTDGKTDYLGAFAITVAVDSLYKNEEDDYRKMLMQSLSDRLAEASAEYLHEMVRKEYWGYAPNENLSAEELFKSHYQGIRPAIGYPSLPDQSLIFDLDKLLNMKETGITLTETGAMSPTSSVAGLYFSHPDSQYFMIGKISTEQFDDYAAESGKSKEYLQQFLIRNLS